MNVKIQPDQSVMHVNKIQNRRTLYSQAKQDESQFNEKIYFYINPTEDRNIKLLKDIYQHKFHLKDLP